MSRAVSALVNTVIIMMIIPIIGIIINWITDKTIRFIYKHCGRLVTLLIANYLTFVGTMHHELSHAIFAFCTGAKIIKIDLFYPEGHTLGKVIFKPRGNAVTKSIQLTMSAIAPVVLGCITEYFLISYVSANSLNGIASFIIYYLIISILLHMTMSKQDIKNAIRGLPICTIIVYCIIFATKLNILTLLNM